MTKRMHVESWDPPAVPFVNRLEFGNFYAANIATLATGYTYSTGSDIVDVRDCNAIALQGFCTCASSATSTTDFNIIARIDADWDTDENLFHSIQVRQPGVGTGGGGLARKTEILDVSGINAIRIGSVVNVAGNGATSAATVTAVNMIYGKKY